MLDLGVRPMCFLQNFSGRLLMLNAIFKTPICNCENDIKVTFHYSLFTNTTTAQKMKFSIKDFSSKCVQIRSFLRIWSHLLEKSLMETSFFVQCNYQTATKNKHFVPRKKAERFIYIVLARTIHI